MSKSSEFLSKGESLADVTTYQAGAAQAALHRNLQKYCDEILDPFGITKMQWLIIGHVLDAGRVGIRVSDLAKTLGTTIPYLTTGLHLLESKGFVKRQKNRDDSRSVLIVIQPEVIDTCNQIEHTLRKGLRRTVYAKVNQKDFLTYMKVLYQLQADLTD